MTTLIAGETNAALLTRRLTRQLESFLGHLPNVRVHVADETTGDALILRGTLRSTTDEAGKDAISQHVAKLRQNVHPPKDADGVARRFSAETDVASETDRHGRLKVTAGVVISVPLGDDDFRRRY